MQASNSLPETRSTRRLQDRLRWLWSRYAWLRLPIGIYVAFRLFTVIAVALGNIPDNQGFGEAFSRWDGYWFLQGIEHGLPSTLPMVDGHVAANPIAFFPLLPQLIRGVSFVTFVAPWVVGIVISGVTGLGCIVAITYLVRQFASQDDARRTAILLSVFPGTFIFSFIYNEGIVLTLIAFGLVALLRERWLLAGVLGLIATATAPIALAFVATCGLCSLRALWRSRDYSSLLAPLLAPLGFLGYMGWLWIHTGNLMAWRLTERGGWQSEPSVIYPFHLVWIFVQNPISQVKTTDLLIIGMVVTAFGLFWAFRQRQPFPVLAYGCVAVTIALISSPIGLRPRFILLAFPVIVAYALRFKGRPFTILVWVNGALLIGLTAFSFFTWTIFP